MKDKTRIQFLKQQLTGGVTQLVKYLDEYVSLVSRKPRKTPTVKDECQERFNLFWSKYPIKKGKMKSAEYFIKKFDRCDKDYFLQMMNSLDKQIAYYNKCKKDNVFCPEFPYPQGWLNQERWYDEVPDTNETNYITPKNTIDDRLK